MRIASRPRCTIPNEGSIYFPWGEYSIEKATESLLFHPATHFSPMFSAFIIFCSLRSSLAPHPHEVRPAEVRLAEVRLAEVRSVEVRTDVGVLTTPGVPGGHALLEHRDVLVVCHRSILAPMQGLGVATRRYHALRLPLLSARKNQTTTRPFRSIF